MSDLLIKRSNLEEAITFNAALQERFPERNWKDNEIFERQDPAETLVYIANDTNKDIALALGRRVTFANGSYFELGLMQTDPDYRGHGVGTEIIQFLQAHWPRIALCANLHGEKPDESRMELTKRLFCFYERNQFSQKPNTNMFYWPRSEFQEILDSK